MLGVRVNVSMRSFFQGYITYNFKNKKNYPLVIHVTTPYLGLCNISKLTIPQKELSNGNFKLSCIETSIYPKYSNTYAPFEELSLLLYPGKGAHFVICLQEVRV